MDVDYTIDWNKVEEQFTDNTKMLIINNPHNPSGKVFTHSDVNSLKTILQKHHNCILLSDEVYEYITFENKHISINTIPEIREKSIIVSSFGKSFHITGWKVGYIICPEKLLNEIKKVHQFLVFSVNSVAQICLEKYLQIVEINDLSTFYKEKRDFFRNLLLNSKFELLPCEGTYFQTLSYKNISEISDLDFANLLVKKHGVASIPMSVFNENKKDNYHLRFCFAKDNQTLINASEKLCKI